MIYVDNKKKSLKTLAKLYPAAEIIDVTSKGNEPYVKLSPFFPHGDIPVPFSKNFFAQSVEGIWQGLKVFEREDIDTTKFYISNMKGIKRTVRKYGKPLGHRKGVQGEELLDYLTARKQIYIPSYAWILQNKIVKEIDQLIVIAKKNDLVFLDYETNCDIENTKKPLSHAGLIKKFIEKKHPEIVSLTFSKPLVELVSKTKSKAGTQTVSEKEKSKSKTNRRKKKSDSNSDSQLKLDL